ncbi:ArfGap-domain-containing protein [Dendrothele bispora CBS 962.96]|uniref:ArfGap-domain-containing protein n=1 Tax=Dendrothele bispora (strain CBS 962.96) TaxID=1314807 RepID=A0A4S8MF24_DENBC|nr:ArfGap-domain-containing protein [Dendrothele bispora CBS 962.96]
MSRQDKATTERNARTLRELVRRPENKTCADCKRNDPRWASWNLGVFLCIRCSGIHRSMGTHISKVKSVDLDIWTPEQMESIQKWGNHRANLYWEAHLKAGHVPPEHKIESFIRSKYESKRWAKNGPPPTDPSTLESDAPPTAAASEPVAQQSSSPPPRATHAPTSSISNRHASSPVTSRQPQARQLLSSTLLSQSPPPRANQAPAATATAAPTAAAAAPAPAPAPAPQNDLFSLDFHSPASTPAPSASPPPKKDMKQDIMSLFSTPSAQPPVPSMAGGGAGFGQFGGMGGGGGVGGMSQAGVWGNATNPGVAQVAQPATTTSMMGNSGTGMWGVSSGWNNGVGSMAPAQPNVWGAPAPVQQQQQQQAQPNLFASSNDVWGNSGTGATTMGGGSQDPFGSFSSGAPAAPKKDDAFGDIWGGFK